MKKKFSELMNYAINSPIISGKGVYLFTKDKKKYLDSTGGMTGSISLGWGNKLIQNEIIKQLKKIAHIDYKSFKDENRTKLKNIILKNKKNKLNEVFFSGQSGAEANEGAMKLSFQYHQANGKKNKKWFISRYQSFHGSTSDTISVGDKKNLYIFKNFSPKYRSKVLEHNIYRHKKKTETEEEYTDRCIRDLKKKILRIGPDNICGFIAETIMGGLVGDVPPTKNYWRKVRLLCDKYNIHLICDEIWCGAGTTGKNFSIDWDNITPDFVTFGKTLTSGYVPLSIIITKREYLQKIKEKFGAILLPSSTYQGHSLGVASALAAQKIINNQRFLYQVIKKGDYFRNTIASELGGQDFFGNIRGRGMRNSLEINSPNNSRFCEKLKNYAMSELNLILNARWHRVCFSPAINIEIKELDNIIEKFTKTYKYVISNWKNQNNEN